MFAHTGGEGLACRTDGAGAALALDNGSCETDWVGKGTGLPRLVGVSLLYTPLIVGAERYELPGGEISLLEGEGCICAVGVNCVPDIGPMLANGRATPLFAGEIIPLDIGVIEAKGWGLGGPPGNIGCPGLEEYDPIEGYLCPA